MPILADLIALGQQALNLRHVTPRPNDLVLSYALLVETNAKKNPDSIMCHFEDRALTWGELNRQANKLAYVLEEQGVTKGDRVALMMENRIEFLTATIGIMKLGAVGALINTSLTGGSLLHCINSVESRLLIVGEELIESIADVRLKLEGCQADVIFIEDTGAAAAPEWCVDYSSIPDLIVDVNPYATQSIIQGDDAFLIFTSGTTGLPKAAVISHNRSFKLSLSSSKMIFRMKRKDCMYLCLPLYHGSALLMGFGAVVISGSSMFLRRKFSASNFLQEARRYKTNSFLYIGELCRYLLNQDEKIDDGDNPIRVIGGNGLRPDIWEQFKSRYKIQKIIEVYGASEANAGFANILNRDNTFGFCTTPFSVVKFDIAAESVVKGDDGHCKHVDQYEAGLLLMEISSASVFEGYTDKKASEKKILRDVFKPGDAYVNSGDLIRQVDVGFAFGFKHYQFVDRVGDTFRWKGQNVSTNEVSEIVNKHPDIAFSNVYGVELPGTDGRAGMMALMLKGKGLDMGSLSELVNQSLPTYARPLFIRQLTRMNTTQTFKLKKNELVDESFHSDKCSDPLYVLKPGCSEYVPLDKNFYNEIRLAKAGF